MISWKFRKQALVATSLNYSKIIALHEVSREYYVRLWSVIHYIQNTFKLSLSADITTIVY